MLFSNRLLIVDLKKTFNKQHTISNKQVKIYKSIETTKSNMQK